MHLRVGQRIVARAIVRFVARLPLLRGDELIAPVGTRNTPRDDS